MDKGYFGMETYDNRFSKFDTRQTVSNTDEEHELILAKPQFVEWLIGGKAIKV